VRCVAIANFERAPSATSSRSATAIATIRGRSGAWTRRSGCAATEALRGAGCAPDTEFAGDFTECSGYRVALEVLKRRPRPTAVFAANDSMAVGLMSAASACGLTVPRDLAVVGFDDIAIARYMNPPLTTVCVDAFGLGQSAARMMLYRARARENVPVRHEVLPAPVVVRRSCGAPPLDRSRPPEADSVVPATFPAREEALP
jgi:LacI family transcriptional regulator